MSEALGTAASAFAVVGVADILVRTGRELYSFLGAVADAPTDINRLRESIDESLLLYQTSKQCQRDFTARAATIAKSNTARLLETANRSLNRELQSLDLIVKKFKGPTTWTRVKYVLSDAKVKKSIGGLENTKSLLISALTLACGELSALGHTRIEGTVRDCFDQISLQFDDLSKAITDKLDSQYQDRIARHGHYQQNIVSVCDVNHAKQMSKSDDHQTALFSKLDTNQRQVMANNEAHKRAFSTMQRTQANVLSRQDTANRVARRTQKQTHSIIQKLNNADVRAAKENKKINASLDSITTNMKMLMSSTSSSVRMRQNGREIFFYGERPDKIMAYLLPLQDNLELAIDCLITEHGKDISISHVEWLRSEFDHLVASASQEKAAQHPHSSATPFDDWIYPDFTNGPPKEGRMNQTRDETQNSKDVAEIGLGDRTRLRNRKHSRKTDRRWSIETPSGDIVISLPYPRKATRNLQGFEEVGFSFKAELASTAFTIQSRFLRNLSYASQPKICAELNIFTEGPEFEVKNAIKLCEYGTLEDLYFALRTGDVSPFYISHTGFNALFFFAIYFQRSDIINYLDSQGIGQLNLSN
ncbi:hypothetical protein GQ44DRAFT_508213 [Phaeosphaeriaceae sp. PMI808]|nr:hypothetical protein GQ44DRAFT_508213 [Phaeosphaeriaceae sp. PMI808]